MKIVLPVSRSDMNRMHLLADVMIKLGNLNAHQLLIVATPPAHTIAFEVAAKLRQICSHVDVAQMDVEPDGGWPQAPNMQFSWSLNYMALNGMRDAFLWMENDCIPQAANWADRLAADYQSCGKPFMGLLVNTPHRNVETGEIQTNPGDTMMMGCGIYPPGMLTDVEIGPVVADLGKRPPLHPTDPWDIYLRWVFHKRGIAHTELICDMWNTQNYVRTADGITCEPAESKFPGRARGGLISSKAVLVHGCKDGSFQALVLSGLHMPEMPRFSASSDAASAGAKVEVLHTVAPADSPPSSDAGVVHGSGPIPPTEEAEPQPLTFTRQDILNVLSSGNIRLNQLADKLKVTKAVLEQALPSLGFSAPKPFWVKDVLVIE